MTTPDIGWHYSRMEGAVTLLSGGTHTSSVCTSWTTAARRDHRASSRVLSRPAAVAAADPSAQEERTQIKEATPSQKGIDAQGRVSVQWPHAKRGSYG